MLFFFKNVCISISFHCYFCFWVPLQNYFKEILLLYYFLLSYCYSDILLVKQDKLNIYCSEIALREQILYQSSCKIFFVYILLASKKNCPSKPFYVHDLQITFTSKQSWILCFVFLISIPLVTKISWHSKASKPQASQLHQNVKDQILYTVKLVWNRRSPSV